MNSKNLYIVRLDESSAAISYFNNFVEVTRRYNDIFDTQEKAQKYIKEYYEPSEQVKRHIYKITCTIEEIPPEETIPNENQ
jgi:uncharacterized protein YfcZ (UPF0381/DUF406 family)